MKNRLRFLFPVIFAIVSGGAAYANQINLVCSAVGPVSSDGRATIVCPKFNEDGLLTLITITLTGNLEGSITLNNNDSNSEWVQGSTAAMVSFGPLLGFTVSSPAVPIVITTANAVPGKTSQTSGNLSSQNSTTQTNSSDLSPYTGSGTFDVPVTAQTTTARTAGASNSSAASDAQVVESAIVSYTFDPSAIQNTSDPITVQSTFDPPSPVSPADAAVPEPATWLLSGLALAAALSYTARRRTA